MPSGALKRLRSKQGVNTLASPENQTSRMRNASAGPTSSTCLDANACSFVLTSSSMRKGCQKEGLVGRETVKTFVLCAELPGQRFDIVERRGMQRRIVALAPVADEGGRAHGPSRAVGCRGTEFIFEFVYHPRLGGAYGISASKLLLETLSVRCRDRRTSEVAQPQAEKPLDNRGTTTSAMPMRRARAPACIGPAPP